MHLPCTTAIASWVAEAFIRNRFLFVLFFLQYFFVFSSEFCRLAKNFCLLRMWEVPVEHILFQTIDYLSKQHTHTRRSKHDADDNNANGWINSRAIHSIIFMIVFEEIVYRPIKCPSFSFSLFNCFTFPWRLAHLGRASTVRNRVPLKLNGCQTDNAANELTKDSAKRAIARCMANAA